MSNFIKNVKKREMNIKKKFLDFLKLLYNIVHMLVFLCIFLLPMFIFGLLIYYKIFTRIMKEPYYMANWIYLFFFIVISVSFLFDYGIKCLQNSKKEKEKEQKGPKKYFSSIFIYIRKIRESLYNMFLTFHIHLFFKSYIFQHVGMLCITFEDNLLMERLFYYIYHYINYVIFFISIGLDIYCKMLYYYPIAGALHFSIQYIKRYISFIAKLSVQLILKITKK